MKISINELLKNPEEVLEKDECKFFFDWFCSDKSLHSRAMNFIPKLKFLVKEGIVDGDKNYVWFKNNCPTSGSLYDDMRISNIETEDFLGDFCPRTGHDLENKCSVWILIPEYKVFDFKDWNTFKREVKNNPEFKKTLQAVFNK